MADGFTAAPAGGQQPLALAGAPFGPQFDLIEALPPAAAAKMRALRQGSADAHRLTIPHADLQEASMARINAERELTRLRAPAQEGGFNLPVDAPQTVAAQKLVVKLTDSFARLQDLSQQRSTAWQARSRVVSAVETWLRDGRPSGTVLEDIETPEVRLNKGESVTDAIARLQRRVREVKADQARIASAPHSSAWAKARVREVVDQLAQRGEPDVSLLLEHGGDLVWPKVRQQADVHGAQRALAFFETVDTLGLLAHLLKPALTAALDKLVDEASDDKAALSPTDRELRTAEVMADLLACEREEATLTWRAMSEQLPVEFRADISVLALLGVALVTVPGATNGQTSWMHAWDIRGGA